MSEAITSAAAGSAHHQPKNAFSARPASAATESHQQAVVWNASARSARLPGTGERVRFYELYWADRARTLPGRLNAFLGTFRIIFESHQFIDAMLQASLPALPAGAGKWPLGASPDA